MRPPNSYVNPLFLLVNSGTVYLITLIVRITPIALAFPCIFTFPQVCTGTNTIICYHISSSKTPVGKIKATELISFWSERNTGLVANMLEGRKENRKTLLWTDRAPCMKRSETIRLPCIFPYGHLRLITKSCTHTAGTDSVLDFLPIM